MMNKQKVKQELSQLQSEFKDYTDEFKKRTEELERIINGSGFDWDFKSKKYTKQLAKVHDLNAILMQLAEYFNPDWWEPDWYNGNKCKYHIAFSNETKNVAVDGSYFYIKPTICFHEDVIDDVIKELENNREKWVHLVGWAE